tara:strand:- start:15632 stop:16552 length:921 start_codon:yes stop_codon:yes gene_type:complete
MKILLTGGSGMVGKNVFEHLSKNTTYILFKPSRLELDLLKYDQVLRFLKRNKIESIIHCAGLVGGIQANILRPYSFLVENIEMGLNLVQAAIELKIPKLINLGSSCMYPKNITESISEEQILTGKLEPTNEGYALAKIIIAKMCEYSNRQFLSNYKTIVPCNLYGKYDSFEPEKSHMIPAAIRKIVLAKKNQDKVEIWGDGTVRREFMYVEDLADFIVFALKNYSKIESLTNVGLGYDFSILDYYKKICEVIGYNAKFRFNINKPVGMRRKLCSVSKIESLGWKASHSLEEGLQKTYKYYEENYKI